MAGEWLADACSVEMGQSPPGDSCNTERIGLPLLNGPTEFGPHHPLPVQFTTDVRKRARPGDVLFCVRGSTTGRMNWADQEYAIGRGVAAIRHKNDTCLQPFVRAVIEYSLPALLVQATGSTFPNVSRDQLCALWWPPLDGDEQRAIAHILGTLDDKIELNRRMSETLEAMARALFKSWFVDFDPVRAKAEGRLPAGRQATPAWPNPGTWCVYALECDNGSIYIGHTDNLERRFEEHRKGKGADWTKRHPPKRVAFWEPCDSQTGAIEREKKLKTGSGREWLKLEIARRDIEEGLPQPPCLPDRQVADLFPDSFEDSELGEIPRGWEAMPLPDAIEVNPTRQLRKGDVAPYLDMANMPTRGHTPDDVIDRAFGSGMRFKNRDTLVARITPCLENGKTAYVDFLQAGQVGWGSTEYIVLCPKPPLPSEFGYCLARSSEFREFAIQSMTGSSGRQRVPAESLSHYLVATPRKDIAARFGRTVSPLFSRASHAARESRALAALRDALLPKLISGDLRVQNAERFLKERGL